MVKQLLIVLPLLDPHADFGLVNMNIVLDDFVVHCAETAMPKRHNQ